MCIRDRNIYTRVLRRNGVADSRQHIGNRISHELTPSINCQLPTRLNNAGDLSLQREFTETDATQVELPQITSRPSTAFTSSVGAHRELRFACRFRNQ